MTRFLGFAAVAGILIAIANFAMTDGQTAGLAPLAGALGGLLFLTHMKPGARRSAR